MITVDNLTLNASGASPGLYEANAGTGANGTAGSGGAGGALGSQGNGGGGGKIFLTGISLNLTPTGAILANGGSTPGFELTSGSSGSGGNGGGTASASGGAGGVVGNAGSGGGGGLIYIDMTTGAQIDNGGMSVLTDAIAARGGSVGDDRVQSGSGGNAGTGPGAGGAGGKIGNNGSGGAGGSVTIDGGTGDITGTSTFGIIADCRRYCRQRKRQIRQRRQCWNNRQWWL